MLLSAGLSHLLQPTPQQGHLELSLLLTSEGPGLAHPVLSNLLSGVFKYSSPRDWNVMTVETLKGENGNKVALQRRLVNFYMLY